MNAVKWINLRLKSQWQKYTSIITKQEQRILAYQILSSDIRRALISLCMQSLFIHFMRDPVHSFSIGINFLGPVHTNTYSFESATFSFRIQNVLRAHAAYSNRIHSSTRI